MMRLMMLPFRLEFTNLTINYHRTFSPIIIAVASTITQMVTAVLVVVHITAIITRDDKLTERVVSHIY